jgi:hypothetical protein
MADEMEIRKAIWKGLGQCDMFSIIPSLVDGSSVHAPAFCFFKLFSFMFICVMVRRSKTDLVLIRWGWKDVENWGRQQFVFEFSSRALGTSEIGSVSAVRFGEKSAK